MTLLLASKSPYRAQMLINAGLNFNSVAAKIDERSIEKPLREADMPPPDIAEMLAISKAENVSARNSGALVIGCDQLLVFEDEILHKPEDMEAARRRLLQLSGKAHFLHSAVVLVQDGEILWSHVETTKIVFRTLSPEFIGHHMAIVGETALTSVGAYQIEQLGIQLVEKIEGDFFSVIGLPLLPLLAELRQLKILES